MTTRTCGYKPCSKRFKPRRPHQRFHAESCRYAAWAERNGESPPAPGQRVGDGTPHRRPSREGRGTRLYLLPSEIEWIHRILRTIPHNPLSKVEASVIGKVEGARERV